MFLFTSSLCFVESLGTKCISSNNQPCMTKPTFIDFYSDEHNQGLRYYNFIIIINRCNGCCNTFDDLPSRIYFPIKIEDVSLNI